MKKIVSRLTAVALAAGLTFGTAGAAFANSENPENTSLLASNAFSVAAESNPHEKGVAEPQAIPAVVATAFLAPAAAAAGEKVGGWVADKLIGIWSAEPANTDPYAFD
ncbi:hypothetical protein SLW73_17070 [Glutamicibacter protophormiae]|uniref:hypothetical protein n=1 Tax=Glutamicibacter protophormiae TaxID=37930 RepID=UPI002A7F76C4|nr:hypothetical protein [Glutamicibacter protophormiae]WPR64581.1 hypothetical protein SLW72_17080 [Glutamicibacter protophormiae]WPR68075.1 hypothetical protein SLW73_17070 [Glutamicibacter protophormiae]